MDIGVVGAGAMGRGIAQLFAQSGHRVHLHDVDTGAAVAARDFVASMLDRAAEKGRSTRDDARAAIARLSIAEALTGLSGCDVVIEAVVEDLAVKRSLVADLEAILRADAIIASNTSSLSIAAIAREARHPERIAGLHFFNPVPLMKLAEVVCGVRTEPAVIDRLTDLVNGTGHTAVTAKDSPGFLVNHAGRGLYTEGLRIVQEGVAQPEAVDLILREGLGFRMGPFELLDLTGLDVSFEVMKTIYAAFWHEPRFRPTPLPALQVDAGLFGRKTGRGFYGYADGSIERPEEPPLSDADSRCARLWPDRSDVSDRAFLARLADRLGDRLDDGEAPAADSLILAAPLGLDATQTALAAGHDPARLVTVDPFADDRRLTVMAPPVPGSIAAAQARRILQLAGLPATEIDDSPGFVAQRVLATIVNIACEIAQQRIAAPADIDTAVRLGLGYPRGPLAWGDAMGAQRILTILERIEARTGDPRYRPSLWLRRRVELGVPLAPAG
jgi:3-hydroxybutyryl-CoA dehydrogenase